MKKTTINIPNIVRNEIAHYYNDNWKIISRYFHISFLYVELENQNNGNNAIFLYFYKYSKFAVFINRKLVSINFGL